MDKKNVWTVIRGSGRPWHDPKWSSARDVLDAVEEENSHGGSSHDSAWQLMHNGKIIVSEGLSTMAYRSRDNWRILYSNLNAAHNKYIEELIPYEKERKQNLS